MPDLRASPLKVSAPWPALVILGPTAIGKTALAVSVARALGSEIFSMDSRQVYRRLDLGTGKDRELYAPTAGHPGAEGVAAHLIDCVDPEETYSLFRFQRDAFAALEAFRTRTHGKVPPVLCGGSGLYAEALLRRYEIPEAQENPELREARMAQDFSSLIGELQSRDPAFAERVDLTSKKRVVRALEVLDAGGPQRSSRRFFPSWEMAPCVICLTCPRDILRERIRERLRQRLRAGLVEEVRRLRESGLSDARLDLLGMEYRAVAAHVRGEMDAEALEAHLAGEIQALAKRQETYFRGMPKRGVPVLERPFTVTADEVLSVFRQESEARRHLSQAGRSGAEAEWGDVTGTAGKSSP